MITLGETGGKVVMVLAVPAAHFIAIMGTIAVMVPVLVTVSVLITVSVFAMVTILVMLPMLAMITVVSYGDTGECEYCCCEGI